MTSTIEQQPELLETGWEPTTPIADTMLRRFVFNHSDSIDAVVKAAGGRTLWTDDFAAADLGRPAAIYNSATLLRPLGPANEGTVLDSVEQFYRRGSGDVWLWSPWPTPDLTARGWNLMGHPPLLLRPAQLAPPNVPPAPVRVVTDAADLREWERVIAFGFPFDDVVPNLPGAFAHEQILNDDRFTMWLAYQGDRPVTAAAMFREHGLAQFAFGVTLPDVRRRGHWAAMVRLRLQAAGALPAAGIFSDDSRLGAERYGFLPLTRFTLWSRHRSSR